MKLYHGTNQPIEAIDLETRKDGGLVRPDKQTIFDYLVSNATDKLAEYLIEDYGLSLADALDRVYRSRTFELLQNPETEFYTQSPAYIYEQIAKEAIS